MSLCAGMLFLYVQMKQQSRACIALTIKGKTM